MFVGLAQALVERYSISWLESFASWAPNAWCNRTMVGIVAWLLLAAGYVFLMCAILHERLHAIEGQLEERINRLTRELAALNRGRTEQSEISAMTPSPLPSSAAGHPVRSPGVGTP